MTSAPLAPYDALLLLSFGGPERAQDVIPFLENVTAGRGIPRERLEQVGQHYQALGGRSPINDQNRALLAALTEELSARGLQVPVYWGNRNWEPYLTDALRQAHTDGARRVLTVVTSAYPSYSGCRQYREDLAAALITLAGEGRVLEVDKVRHYFNVWGFVEPTVQAVLTALQELPDDVRDDAHLAFVTHSVPTAMAEVSGPEGNGYVTTSTDVCRTVSARLSEIRGGSLPWHLVYCSRSGPPNQPWLEPDVNDLLRELHAGGVPAVVVAPVGFVSDHMEVRYDLDTEARQTADELGLAMTRAATVGTAGAFVSALVDLVQERAAAERAASTGQRPPQRPAVGDLGPSHDVCPVGCCRNLRGDQPAACGVDWSGASAAAAGAAR